ncbi:MAG: hypothetical protein A2X64_07640 [Ignavibacteria bacterium GWF2_33_9]|nr:MAG: hypothetical protein A2X64_07640 [Ignavibacteria bacterium GWF2_33_9]
MNLKTFWEAHVFKRLLNTLFYHSGLYKLFKVKAIEGLHLGCGSCKIEGFINIDASLESKCDVLGSVQKLNFPDNSVKIIYNSHVFEHIPKRRVRKVLSRWYRALKPDGKIYICVPDLENLCKLYLENIKKEKLTQEEWEKICTITNVIYGGQNNKYDFHYDGYSFTTIKYWLEETGFKNIKKIDEKPDFINFNDSSGYLMDGLSLSLNIEATK